MGGLGSGQRSWSQLAIKRKAVDRAWQRTHDMIANPQHPQGDTAALTIAARDMTSKVESTADVRLTVTPEEQELLAKYSRANRLGELT